MYDKSEKNSKILLDKTSNLPVEWGWWPSLSPEFVHREKILNVVVEEFLEQFLCRVITILGPLFS